MSLNVSRAKALVGAGVLAVTLAVPAVASAQVDNGVLVTSASENQVLATTTVPEVLGVQITTTTAVAPAAVQPEVLGETVSNTNLAVTGSDIVGMVAIGATLVAFGTALIAFRRRSMTVGSQG